MPRGPKGERGSSVKSTSDSLAVAFPRPLPPRKPGRDALPPK
jgi:hypothetical protein